MHLTELAIRKLKVPKQGRRIYFDDSMPGFGVRVSKRYKTYVVLHGKKQRQYKTLGRFPDMKLSEARREARRLLATRPALKSQTAYEDAVDDFLEHCKTKNRDETVRQYKNYLKAFEWPKRVSDIARSDILAHLDTYKEKPAARVHSISALKVFFNWCIRQEIIDRHPVAGERTTPVHARERVLSRQEIREFWAYEFPHFSTIVKLCLLTGQRRSEIAALSPKWVRDSTITFPPAVTKNGRRHTIPITPMVEERLSDIPFGDPWNGWSNGKRRIDKNVKIPHWTLHDLRRTFSTIHAEIGTPIHVTERLLNHATGSVSGVAGVYNRYSYLEEMRNAQERYEQHLQTLLQS